MQSEETMYYIAIDLIPGIGSTLAKRLIAYCGSAQAVFTAKNNSLQKIPGIGALLSKEIASQNVLKRAEKEMEFIRKHRINTYCYTDDNYSERLRQCDDGPVVFFSKGNIDFNREKFLSIVGTRHATSYGQAICEKIIGGLAELGHRAVIVSGLAYGIDICAHRAALNHKLDTVAVMATGLNQIYPSSHTGTARQIVEHGALISDFISDTELDRKNFLKRNRIIAGLSDATLVIESKAKGGALITADIAQSYNREVFAVPGRAGDLFSAGCNNLIRQNKAALVQNAEEVEYLLGWEKSANLQSKQLPLFSDFSEEEQLIIEALRNKDSEAIDVISYRTDIPVGKLSSLLLGLEFKDIIKSLPGKQYLLRR
ncbi:MAG: DNA-processing protein DprA [Bacteroidales bacterium]|nr:DNA-processing protein DprA [Bacteroidales bacterium]MCL2133204.1 DNA-processing protein DprA [Bacteroidales bacterium]